MKTVRFRGYGTQKIIGEEPLRETLRVVDDMYGKYSGSKFTILFQYDEDEVDPESWPMFQVKTDPEGVEFAVFLDEIAG